MRRACFGYVLVGLITVYGASCTQKSPDAETATSGNNLGGTWHATVQFQSGAFASVKDLTFMYVFNDGGTMTESSNYDGAPPVPPAYGIWRHIDSNQYEAKYEFYMTRVPDSADGMAVGTGFLPAGHGVLTETITLSDDGATFVSRIRMELFDKSGNPVEGGGDAIGEGRRMQF